VSKESGEFRRVAADFDGDALSIIRIDRIGNTIWLMQYLNQKQTADARLNYDMMKFRPPESVPPIPELLQPNSGIPPTNSRIPLTNSGIHRTNSGTPPTDSGIVSETES
ncbi:unnamed protein product, partial [Rotaria sp. Silwood2]